MTKAEESAMARMVLEHHQCLENHADCLKEQIKLNNKLAELCESLIYQIMGLKEQIKRLESWSSN